MLLWISLKVPVFTAVSTKSVSFLMKANCPWLLKIGAETARNGVGVAVGDSVLVGMAVFITSIVGAGVWLGWLVAAASGVAGLLVWQATRVKTAVPQITSNSFV